MWSDGDEDNGGRVHIKYSVCVTNQRAVHASSMHLESYAAESNRFSFGPADVRLDRFSFNSELNEMRTAAK